MWMYHIYTMEDATLFPSGNTIHTVVSWKQIPQLGMQHYLKLFVNPCFVNQKKKSV